MFVKKLIPIAVKNQWHFLKSKVKRSIKYSKPVDLFEYDKNLYWMDPRDIKYATKHGLHIIENENKILNGNWDYPYIKFNDLDVYISIRNRIENGIEWKETAFYKRVSSEINKGISKWGCENLEQLDHRFASIDVLIQDMRTNGYRTEKYNDEITVNISREGLVLLNHGRHRLACAKLLEIKKIPIKITARHKKWAKLKQEVLNYATQNNGMVYAPICHIDLQSIPSQHQGRFEIIKSNLGISSGKLLDIGSHWGYFAHKFEDMGFNCTAIEQNEECFYFLEKLRKSSKKNFKAIKEDIMSFLGKPQKFDVVIALSIFHWFIRKKDTFQKFKIILSNLKMKEMFFQSHSQNHTLMQNAYCNFSPEDFVNFIIENSCLDAFKLIGVENNRKIFKIYKTN
ncbi:MAG: methyltransferase domain-containing protein [Candidatus Omnitrophica bacterium]|nr:methyltransferase domain-containing protein [Candidatus Omnitrophota bacterium]